MSYLIYIQTVISWVWSVSRRTNFGTVHVPAELH